MSSDNGFVSLRLNNDGDGSGNESFWPSFTDIMTVIVMIFLIALVVLLMRNMELVQQLRNTMDAERMAAELARTTGEEKDSLSVRLITTENELSDLRLQMMQLQEIRSKQLETIKDRMNQISSLKAQRDQMDINNTQLQQKNQSLEQNNQRLSLQKDQLTQQNNRMEQQLTVSNEQMQQLQQILAQLKTEQQTMQQQYNQLQTDYADRRNQLEAALNDINMSSEALALLQGDYDNLKVKYDKLVRPARTPVGKYVVEVRYVKQDDKYLISYKTPEQEGFKSTTQNTLDKKLAALKAKDPAKLYIKVIFPENSGLSYSEAWEFTSRLHKKYDYYFQE